MRQFWYKSVIAADNLLSRSRDGNLPPWIQAQEHFDENIALFQQRMGVFTIARSQADITAQYQFGTFSFVRPQIDGSRLKYSKCLAIADGVSNTWRVVGLMGAFISSATSTDCLVDVSQQLWFDAVDADHELTMFATALPVQ